MNRAGRFPFNFQCNFAIGKFTPFTVIQIARGIAILYGQFVYICGVGPACRHCPCNVRVMAESYIWDTRQSESASNPVAGVNPELPESRWSKPGKVRIDKQDWCPFSATHRRDGPLIRGSLSGLETDIHSRAAQLGIGLVK